MITITDAAGTYLNGLLGEVSAPDEIAIRVVMEEQGLALRLDGVRPGDESFTHNGRTILLLDAAVSSALEGRTLDVEDAADGPQLKLGVA
jgi:Fe-S cluster assembly iron-binding protein IscA